MSARAASCALLLAACGSDVIDAPGGGACEATHECISDPWPHCVARDDCLGDDDCLSGLTCADEPTATQCRADPGRRCRWRIPRDIDRLALVNDFAVPTMSLNIDASPPLRFTWNAPAGTAFVACGVFTCNPVIASQPEEPRQITNAGRCLLDFQVVDAAGSWLSTPSQKPDSPPSAACAGATEHERIIELTAVGCWAYSHHAIVAASELHRIDPAFLTREGATSASGVPSEAGCELDADADGVFDAEGEPCYDRAHELFGACADGRCAPRCTSAADCELADTRLFGTSPSSCDWVCRPVTGSRVGVCARPPAGVPPVSAPAAR